MYGFPVVSQETRRILPERLQLTSLYNRHVLSAIPNFSLQTIYPLYIRALSHFYIHGVTVSVTLESDFLTHNEASVKITPQSET